jgi:hypothetical protein
MTLYLSDEGHAFMLRKIARTPNVELFYDEHIVLDAKYESK